MPILIVNIYVILNEMIKSRITAVFRFMIEIIDLEIQYTVDDYVRALSFIQKRQFVHKYAFIIVLVTGIFSIVFIALISPAGSSETILTSTIVFLVMLLPIIAILVFLKYFPNPILKWNIRRQYKSSPLMREIQHISFNEDGIGGHTNLSAGKTNWIAFIEVTETKEDFYFFTTKKMAQFVPKRAFESEFQQNELRGLAKRKLGDRVKM